ncbi:MAG: hypothetical protein MK185_15470 [Saccharospirillaceae bacterium]|nr:hypothetical protein [Saccharospirillaceae bacterium]
MKKSLALISLTLLTSATMAIENSKTVCTHDAETRVIEVVYNGESSVPCEVQYTKSTGTQTLWNAQNAEGYCEEKAQAFVAKQQGWGWDCQNAAADNSQTDEELIQDAEPSANEQEPVAASE